MHLGSSSRCLRLSPHPHGHLHVRLSSPLTLPFCFLLYLPPLFFFFLYLKSVVNLHSSANESMYSSDQFLFSTSCEPNAYDFEETSVEPYTELLDSPPLFPTKSLLRTPTTMTLHSKKCSTKYIEHKLFTLYEKSCLSVCRRRQCTIEQGDLLGIHGATR